MSNKHDANVRKSTLVNFQIGLVASLLFTYVMFQVYTAVPVIDVSPPDPDFPLDTSYVIGDIEVYKEPKKELAVKTVTKKVPDLTNPEIIDDDAAIKAHEDEYKSEPAIESAPVNPGDIDDLPEVSEPIDYPFEVVEFAPVFPGCEELPTNKQKAQCFSDKVKRVVSKKFNTDLGAELGLSGLQRIYVQFDVYKDGTIQNIKARATHPLLEKEAIRVVKKFPTMTPGRQRDTNVTVKYQLPIVFKVEN